MSNSRDPGDAPRMCSNHTKNVGSEHNSIPFYSILDNQEAIFNFFRPLITLWVLHREKIETRSHTRDYKNICSITNSPISLPLPVPE